MIKLHSGLSQLPVLARKRNDRLVPAEAIDRIHPLEVADCSR